MSEFLFNDDFDQEPYYVTTHGAAYLGDSLDFLQHMVSDSADLIVTSPPFALKRKKEYGNVHASSLSERKWQ